MKDCIKIITEDETGLETEHHIPTVNEVCQTCRGNGSSSAHLGAFTVSEFNEAFDTPEDRADYFNGAFDRPCSECGGNKVVQVVDEDRCTQKQLDVYYQDITEKNAARQEQLYWARVHGEY